MWWIEKIPKIRLNEIQKADKAYDAYCAHQARRIAL